MSQEDPTIDPWRCPQPPPKLLLEDNLPPAPPALEKLGPSPFAKTRFPFLGFLATVYDHIAAQARQRGQNPDCD